MTRDRHRALARWLVPLAATLWLGHGVAADARPQQGDDFEAALRRMPATRPVPVPTSPTPTRAASRGSGQGRAFMRNHLTVEQRRAMAAETKTGIVLDRFRGRPTSPAQLDSAYNAIQTREMDPYAYLLQATAGTPVPPQAKPVRCASDERRLFYTLGIEDPVLNAYVAAQGQASRDQAGFTRPSPAATDSYAPDKTVATVGAFYQAHGYRPAPSYIDPHRYVPADERAGVVTVRVSIVKNATMALSRCGAKGATLPPTGPGIELSLHFPGTAG